MKKSNLKKWLIGFGLVAAVTAYAADRVIQEDKVTQGRGDRAIDKRYIFDVGQGASNPEIKADEVDHDMSLISPALNLESILTKIGDGTAANQELVLDDGNAGSNAKIFVENSTGQLKFQEVGGTAKRMGSGGGGGGVNLLVEENFNFEDGDTKWTESGTSAFTIETSAPLFGANSGKWDPGAASENLDSTLVAVPVGLQGNQCLVRMFYLWDSGTTGEIKLQAHDGTNVLADLELEQTTGSVREAFAVFTCPSSGSVRARLTSTADAALVTFDEVHVGSNIREVQVASAELVVHAKYVDTSCQPSLTSASFIDYSTDADCDSIQVLKSSVAVDTADTDSLNLVATLPPGRYKVTASFVAQTSAGAGTFLTHRLTDGTNNGPAYGRNMAAATSSHRPNVSVENVFEYGSSGVRTFKVQAAVSSGSTDILAESANGREFVWTVERFPLASEQAVSIDAAKWDIDVNLGGANPVLPTGATSTYTEIAASTLDMVLRTGSAAAEVPCSGTNPSTGLTCSAGNESVGVVFTPPFAGKFEACAYFIHSQQSGNATTFQIVETPNNAQTILQEGGTRIGGYDPQAASQYMANTNCGTFTFSSVGKKTLRLMHENSGGITSANLIADRSAGAGQRDIHITVRPVAQFSRAIQLDNLVTTNFADGLRTEYARIDYTAGVPAVADQSGSWITSITDTGTGDLTLVLPAGIFSSTPRCSGMADATVTVGGAHLLQRETGSSATAVQVNVIDSNTDTNVDEDFNIICMGKK